MFRSVRLARAFAAALVLAAVAVIPAVLATAALAHDYTLGEIRIEHPWARATPHGAKVAGGFLVIRNQGRTADRLASVASDVAEHSEIHEMAMKDGVMTMRPLAGGLAVPAGGQVALQPGGLHLMFVGLKRPLAKGDSFKATLVFEKAGSVEVSFQVDAIGAGGAGHRAGPGHN